MNQCFKRIKALAAVAAVFSVLLLTVMIELPVSASDSYTKNIYASELKVGQSPLVEAENSKRAEESRLAEQDDSSAFKSIKNKYESLKDSFTRNFLTNNGWKLLIKGIWVTLRITFFAVILGIAVGFLIGIIRSTHDKTGRLGFLNGICKLYITIIRGTPVVVQLLIINFVIFASFSISKLLVAVVAFGINSGAYVAEIFRSGIMSVDNGQTEAGRSLGLTYSQTMRSIIMPQAFKNVLPALGNEFIVLLKETSVCGYIALDDLTRAGYIIQSNTYDAFWPLIGVAVVYLVIVMGLTKLLSILERRLRASDSR